MPLVIFADLSPGGQKYLGVVQRSERILCDKILRTIRCTIKKLKNEKEVELNRMREV
jgi:hypothetical protein